MSSKSTLFFNWAIGLTRRIVAQSLAEAFNRRYNLNIRLILLFSHELIFQFVAVV